MPPKFYDDPRWYVNLLHWLRDVAVSTAIMVAFGAVIAIANKLLDILQP